MNEKIVALLLGGVALLIGLAYVIIGIYSVAERIAPGLGIDPNKAATVALVALMVNIVLWLALFYSCIY